MVFYDNMEFANGCHARIEEAKMGDEDATSARAYILEALGEHFDVEIGDPVSGHVRIGRGSADFRPDVLIPSECTSASRQHAVLDLRGERPVLEDRSRFGTIVNGIRLEGGVKQDCKTVQACSRIGMVGAEHFLIDSKSPAVVRFRSFVVTLGIRQCCKVVKATSRIGMFWAELLLIDCKSPAA